MQTDAKPRPVAGFTIEIKQLRAGGCGLGFSLPPGSELGDLVHQATDGDAREQLADRLRAVLHAEVDRAVDRLILQSPPERPAYSRRPVFRRRDNLLLGLAAVGVIAAFALSAIWGVGTSWVLGALVGVAWLIVMAVVVAVARRRNPPDRGGPR
jgi:hypothetical protein